VGIQETLESYRESFSARVADVGTGEGFWALWMEDGFLSLLFGRAQKPLDSEEGEENTAPKNRERCKLQVKGFSLIRLWFCVRS
jgi:hypothetical protein